MGILEQVLLITDKSDNGLLFLSTCILCLKYNKYIK